MTERERQTARKKSTRPREKWDLYITEIEMIKREENARKEMKNGLVENCKSSSSDGCNVRTSRSASTAG